jgi:hypothetical protein
VVALKLGPDGALVCDRAGVSEYVAALPGPVLDTTGAGDAFCAGFLAAWLLDGDVARAGHQGVRVAAEVVGRVGVRVATEDVHKASVRDLPALVGFGLSGATTVAATASLAAMAGIRVFATGGNGGVHRAAGETFDESADLTALARTPITVVAAGVKSILDVPATLERLETLGVPGLGYRTSRFPAFCCTDSGHQLEWSAPDSEAVAAVMRAHDRLGLPGRHPGRQPGPSRPATGPQTARTAPRRCVCSGGPPTGSRQGGHSLPAGAHRPVLGRGEPHGQPRPGREQRSRRPRHRSRVVRRR